MPHFFRVLLFVALCFVPLAIYAGGASGPMIWDSTTQSSMRYLTLNAMMPLLGKDIPFSLSFHADAMDSKDVHGTIGFDLYVDKIATLKAFHFADFEGPDAPAGAKALMQITLASKGKPAKVFKVAVSGSYPSDNNFVFGLAELSNVAKSDVKTILRALAQDVDTMQIIVTDYRDAKTKLVFNIPVTTQRAEFKTLLKDFK
jgi:hypothetical protein